MMLSNRSDLWQLIKFNLVGVMNTTVDFLVFALLIYFNVHHAVAQCLSYGSGTVNSFFMNKWWTFGQRGTPAGKQLLKFLIMNITVLAISLILLDMLTNYFQTPILIAKLIVVIVTMFINFAGSRLWVFKQ